MDVTVHLDGNPDTRIEGFFEAKVFELTERIKVLEYDNAELQKWVNDTCVPRMVEMNEELMNRYNQKRYRNTNFRNEYGKAPGRR